MSIEIWRAEQLYVSNASHWRLGDSCLSLLNRLSPEAMYMRVRVDGSGGAKAVQVASGFRSELPSRDVAAIEHELRATPERIDDIGWAAFFPHGLHAHWERGTLPLRGPDLSSAPFAALQRSATAHGAYLRAAVDRSRDVRLIVVHHEDPDQVPIIVDELQHRHGLPAGPE